MQSRIERSCSVRGSSSAGGSLVGGGSSSTACVGVSPWVEFDGLHKQRTSIYVSAALATLRLRRHTKEASLLSYAVKRNQARSNHSSSRSAATAHQASHQ